MRDCPKSDYIGGLMKHTYFSEALSEFNRMYKEMDAIYHGLALTFGISDSMFWILYILSESKDGITQYELCHDWYFSKQTISSAISALVKEGYIYKRETFDAHNRKILTLTEKGEIFIKKTIDNVKIAEANAFGGLTQEECAEFLRLNDKYLQSFRKEAKSINHSSEAQPLQRTN